MSFADVDVAVSIAEAAKPRVFLLCGCRRVYTVGEAVTPRVFCYVDVAVSIAEAAKPRGLLLTSMSQCL